MIPPQAILTLCISAASFGMGWQVAVWRADGHMSALKTEYLKRDFKALENAHADTFRLQTRKDEAERKARARQTALAGDLAANRDALGRLSDVADSALRAANESHGSCIADANALTVVFGQCATRLSDVAADADQLASDRQTLIESWPARPQ